MVYRGGLFLVSQLTPIQNTIPLGAVNWVWIPYQTVHHNTEDGLPVEDKLFEQSADQMTIIAKHRFYAQFRCSGVFAPQGAALGHGVVQLCPTTAKVQGAFGCSRPVNQSVINFTTTDIATETDVFECFPGTEIGIGICYYGPASVPFIPLIGGGFQIEVK